MFRGLKWGASLFIPVVVIGAVIVLAHLLRVPISQTDYQSCLQAAQSEKNNHPDCKRYETIWERGRSDPVAYYTLWLTLFTGALAGVGIGQGILLWRQIALARDEFNATHRPKLIVHAIEYRAVHNAELDSDCIAARLWCFNVGDAPAENLEVYAKIVPRNDLRFGAEWPFVTGFSNTTSGEKFEVDIHPVTPAESLDITVTFATDTQSPPVYCVGEILYWDAAGNLRTTGFCYEMAQGQLEPRWILAAREPEYQYAY